MSELPMSVEGDGKKDDKSGIGTSLNVDGMLYKAPKFSASSKALAVYKKIREEGGELISDKSMSGHSDEEKDVV